MDTEILSFKTAKEWERWLSRNHAKSDGIWIKFSKKASKVKTVTYAEALDVSLCYGWIDSQVKKHDESSYIQRYTPRRKRSIWSKRNTDHVARLIEEGRMKPAGIAQVEAAKADGRWAQAYDSPSAYVVPADFLKRLAKDKKALTFYKTLTKANTYAIGWRLQTAKRPETRERRMQMILGMLSRGEKFH